MTTKRRKDREIGTCACGCGRTGRIQNRATGYVRACHERWKRAGFPESGPPAAVQGKRAATTGTAAHRRAAGRRDRWAVGVAVDVVTGRAEEAPPGWQGAAVCRDLPDGWTADAWFPEDDETVSEEVRAACDRCPVRRECLIEGLTLDDPHGIRAGLTTYQRRRRLGRAERRLAPARVAA